MFFFFLGGGVLSPRFAMPHIYKYCIDMYIYICMLFDDETTLWLGYSYNVDHPWNRSGQELWNYIFSGVIFEFFVGPPSRQIFFGSSSGSVGSTQKPESLTLGPQAHLLISYSVRHTVKSSCLVFAFLIFYLSCSLPINYSLYFLFVLWWANP